MLCRIKSIFLNGSTRFFPAAHIIPYNALQFRCGCVSGHTAEAVAARPRPEGASACSPADKTKLRFNTTPADTLKPPSDQLALIASASKAVHLSSRLPFYGSYGRHPIFIEQRMNGSDITSFGSNTGALSQALRVLLPKDSFRPKKENKTDI